MRSPLYRDNTGGFGRKIHLTAISSHYSKCGKELADKFLTTNPAEVDCGRCLQLMARPTKRNA